MNDLVKVKNSIPERFANRVESVKTQNLFDGQQLILEFKNGYGASIVKHFGTLGEPEIAVLDEEENITYDTPVTSDVIRCARKEDLFDILNQIANL